jgi:uncharacterized protein YfdQ (DUF2303 family)
MTTEGTTAFEDALENLSDNAVRLAYEVLDSTTTPALRHVIAVTADEGLEVHEIDEEQHLPFPRRPHGNRTVCELDSFLAELARRPLGAAGTLWGNAANGKLVAVYNDHDPQPHVAGWRDDTLTLQLKQDPDWAAWHALSGKYFRQTEFGDQIEELLHTVVDPDQAELLEIIDSVRASTKGEFQSSINRANGAQTVVFNTEISATAGKATNSLEVPQFVKLQLRPWDGHPQTYEVNAYFRLKVDQGHLTLAIKLKPTQQIIRTAWAEITSTVAQTVDKPVYAQ